MIISQASLRDVLIIEPVRHGDNRGFFSETFKRSALEKAGVSCEWVQDNHSYSSGRGVVRGLHFQIGASAQAKLLRVSRGAILDVAVDVRRNSPTYGHHVAVELSASNWRQLLIPAGFAHGFCTLTEETEVLYKASADYDPEAERGVLWNDPDLQIPWPISSDDATLSERDKKWPPLKGLTDSM